MQRLIARARAGRMELALFAGAFGALWLVAVLLRQDATRISYAAHFVEQARSWLAGRMDVPTWLGHDLVQVGGKSYIVYPPAPALLMLPFVAVLGAHFSDIWFTWLCGALNVALLYHLLQAMAARGWSRRTPRENAVIAVTFGFGTIALWLALGGTVWFTAQTLAITFTVLMLLGAVRHNWWMASAALGALFLTRSPDILGAAVIGAMMLAYYREKTDRQARWSGAPCAADDVHREVKLPARNNNPSGLMRDTTDEIWIRLRAVPFRAWVALAVPFGAAVVLWMVRNQLYFGHPLSSGYDLQIQQDYPQIHYGLMSWHYVWPNVVVDFLNMPSFSFKTPYDVNPLGDLLRGGNGTSIFFTTPLFLLFFAPARSHAPRWLRLALWVCVALLVGFTLFWNLTGWYQVGARYLFDAYPYLFLLLAMRGERLDWRWLALACLGALVNLALANVFWCRNGACLGNHLTLRWLAFDTLLAAIPLGYIAAWLWLRKEASSLQRHAAIPRWHGEAQETALRQPRANGGDEEIGQQQTICRQLAHQKRAETQGMRATEKARQIRPKGGAAEGLRGIAHHQGDEDVRAEAGGRQQPG